MSGPIDTHVHLLDPHRFPFQQGTDYRPEPHEWASVEALVAQLDEAGMHGAMVVAPTVGYGHDLSALLDALARHPGRLIGVARLTGRESDAQLAALACQGIRGVRLDLRHDGVAHLDLLESLSAPRRWWSWGWFVQVQADGAAWARIHERLGAWPNPLVIDHCGLPDPAEGLDQPGFRAVLDLATRRATWLKLSGPFRFSRGAWPHADTDRYAKVARETFGAGRCLWGSDWPFVRSGLAIGYADAAAHLSRWVPSASERREILCAAPAALLETGAG